MSLKSNGVNLDAMIKREDFAANNHETSSFESISTISLRDFIKGGLVGPNLRKPDFQRETNHWSPSQVVSLLECFINGDLIPSVILWKSPAYLFIIDGCHRLSVLKAWIEDDYGDGPISQAYFGYNISNEQKKNAENTRKRIQKDIGTWQHFLTKSEDTTIEPGERKKITILISRGLPIQWVNGNADKAETSFFKINTKGTPLDDIEELLLKNRKKPISIAARAIIRAGTGHRYWSSFDKERAESIENTSQELHKVLFDPEIKRPIKTLDLPLGGPKGIRAALQALIELVLISTRNQQGSPKEVKDTLDDSTGEKTVEVLKMTLSLAKRVTGNDSGSLGLHPAVYFYGPTGRHSNTMFMGTMALLGKKISNNDKSFFEKFTTARANLERILIDQKELIATIIQKHGSRNRIDKYSAFLEKLIDSIADGHEVNDEDIVTMSGLSGKIVLGSSDEQRVEFSEDIKSKVFIDQALESSIKCPICKGYIDTEKSMSYDHDIRVRDGGSRAIGNCNLTHPYCNQSIKQ